VKNVLFVILPDVVLLDVAGAGEAFRMAEQEVPGSYALQFVGPARRVNAAVGLRLDALAPLPAQVADGSIIVVTGVASRSLDLASQGATRVASWLADVVRNETVTLMCVCAGSLIAALAGLLRSRECTTHHKHLEQLAGIEPTATVHSNRIFVEDGRILTSAGVTSGTDLALYLIGQQLGHRVAAAVARDLVVYMRRSATDPQLSPWVMHRNHIHPGVHRVQDAITRDPARDWSTSRLAAVACMSSRNLTRLFAQHAGCSPLDYVQRLRVALARDLIANSDLGLESVAERSGFSSAHQLRRVWRRWEPVSPARHRSAHAAG
jgi:transcriptional regulator GlxA family with amidase domain